MHTVFLRAHVLSREKKSQIWHLIACSALGARFRPIGGCQSVIFPLFSCLGGFLCRCHCLPDRHCAAESKTAEELFMEQIKPALQLFPGKDCSNSALQPFASGLLETIAILWPAPAHASPVGSLQSISSTKCYVPLPWQVWIAQLGG